MESLQDALGHGVAVAARIGYAVFKSAILKALFIVDEEHLELAIEQDVDLLPLVLIYAPKWVKMAQGLAGRSGREYERKVTLETSLKFLHDECARKKSRYYDIIVNVPQETEGGSNPPATSSGIEEVYPPPGADMKRVNWFYGNVKRLLRFIFHGEVPESSRKWGVDHLRWLAKQKQQGKTQVNELLEEAHKQSNVGKEN